MNGKGSKPRPFSVDQKTFDDNWDKVFRKKEQPVKLSTFFSEDGNREASVIMGTNGTFSVECYESKELINTIDVGGRSLHYAEDTAENFVNAIGSFAQVN